MLKRAAMSLFVIFALFLSAYLINSFFAPEEMRNTPVISEKAEINERKEQKYTIKDMNGDIVIISEDGSIKTGIKTQNMREHDKKLLLKGMEGLSYEDVLKLIEDFNS